MLSISYTQVWFKNRRAKFRKKQRALKVKDADKDKLKEAPEGTAASTSTEGGSTDAHIDTAGALDSYLTKLNLIITTNGCSFGCPIIYMDTIHNAILVSHINWYNKPHSVIEKPYLATIASNYTVILASENRIFCLRPLNWLLPATNSQPLLQNLLK